MHKWDSLRMRNNKIKREFDSVVSQLNEILNQAQSMKGDLRIKETTVKKLKKDLHRIRELLETTLDFSVGKELGQSISKIEENLKIETEIDIEYSEKEIQTSPVRFESNVVPIKMYIQEERIISDTISTPRHTIVQTPTAKETPEPFKVNKEFNKPEVIKAEVKAKKIPEKPKVSEVNIEKHKEEKKIPKKISSKEHEESHEPIVKPHHTENKAKLLRKIQAVESDSSEEEVVKKKTKTKAT